MKLPSINEERCSFVLSCLKKWQWHPQTKYRFKFSGFGSSGGLSNLGTPEKKILEAHCAGVNERSKQRSSFSKNEFFIYSNTDI